MTNHHTQKDDLSKQLVVSCSDTDKPRISNNYTERAYVFISNYNPATFNPLLLFCQTSNWIIQNVKQKARVVDSTILWTELPESRELLKRTLCLLIRYLILSVFVDRKHPLGKDFLKNLNCDNAFLTTMNIPYKPKLFVTWLVKKMTNFNCRMADQNSSQVAF